MKVIYSFLGTLLYFYYSSASTLNDCGVIGKVTFEIEIEDAANPMTVGGCSHVVAEKIVSALVARPANSFAYGTVLLAVVDDTMSTAMCTEEVGSSSAEPQLTSQTTEVGLYTTGSTSLDTTVTNGGIFDTTTAGTTGATHMPTTIPMLNNVSTTISRTAPTSSLPLIVGASAGCVALALLLLGIVCLRRRNGAPAARRASSSRHSAVRVKTRSGRSSGHYRRTSELMRSVDRGRSRVHANAPPPPPSSSVYGFVPSDVILHQRNDGSHAQQGEYSFMPHMAAASAGSENVYTVPPSSSAPSYVSIPESTYMSIGLSHEPDAMTSIPEMDDAGSHYTVLKTRSPSDSSYVSAPSTAFVVIAFVALVACGAAQMSVESTVVRIELSGVHWCLFDEIVARSDLVQALRTSSAYAGTVVDQISSRISFFNTPRFTLESSCAVPCERLPTLNQFMPWNEHWGSGDFPTLCVGRAANGHLFGLGQATRSSWPSTDISVFDLPVTLPHPSKEMGFKAHFTPPQSSGRLDITLLQPGATVKTAGPDGENMLWVSLFEFNVDPVDEPACFVPLAPLAPHFDASQVENRRPLSLRQSHHWIYLHGAIRVDSVSGASLFVVPPSYLPPREYRLLTTARIDTNPEHRYAVALKVDGTGLIEGLSDFYDPMLFGSHVRTIFLDSLKWERDVSGETLSGSGDEPLNEQPVSWNAINVSHADAKSVAVGSFLFASCSVDRDLVHLGGRFSFSSIVVHIPSGTIHTYLIGYLPSVCPPPARRILLSVGTSSATQVAFPMRVDIAPSGAIFLQGIKPENYPTTSHVWSFDGLSYSLNDEGN